MINIYEAQESNKRKSALVMLVFVVVVVATIYVFSRVFSLYLGYEPGGLGVIGLAFIISGFLSFGGYFFSDKIVLSISGARPADRKRDFNFFTAAENLSIAAGVSKPKLYVIEDSAPNAFATGRDPDHAKDLAGGYLFRGSESVRRDVRHLGEHRTVHDRTSKS